VSRAPASAPPAPSAPSVPAQRPAGEPIVLQGRGITGGVAEAAALVSPHTISGWGGFNPTTGTIIESRHALRGQSVAGKVLVFPGAKGSSGWSVTFHMARLRGTAPAAMIFNTMTPKVALGAVVMRVPAVTELERDPLQLIASGDWVRVDAERGQVWIWKA